MLFLFHSQGLRVYTFQGHVHSCNHATFNKKVSSAWKIPFFLPFNHHVPCSGPCCPAPWWHRDLWGWFRISGGSEWPHLPDQSPCYSRAAPPCCSLLPPLISVWCLSHLPLLGSLITLFKWNFWLGFFPSWLIYSYCLKGAILTGIGDRVLPEWLITLEWEEFHLNGS